MADFYAARDSIMPSLLWLSIAPPFTWRGIDLTIRHLAGRFAGMDHIEVVSAGRAALPITATGYKSLFILPERIAEYGTPTDYVQAWLDHEAQAESWKLKEAKGRQLSLF